MVMGGNFLFLTIKNFDLKLESCESYCYPYPKVSVVMMSDINSHFVIDFSKKILLDSPIDLI